MAPLLGVVGLLVLVGLHTLLAAVMTRFFRLRLESRWGWIVYGVLLIPPVLLASTLILAGVVGLGVDLGSPAVAAAVTIGLPLALGFAIDTLYIPPPDEVDLPEPDRGR